MITGHVLWLATQIIEILASSLHHRHLRHTSVKFDSEWLQVVYYGYPHNFFFNLQVRVVKNGILGEFSSPIPLGML